MVRVVLNIVFLAFISSIILADDACKYTSSDGTIDISSLAGPGDSPQYKDVQAVGSGWKYSFNPCKPFNEGASCRGASVCQVNGDGSDQYMLGTQGSAVWIPPPGAGSTPTLKFSYQNPTDLKQVTMNLFCPQEGESESFDFLMESPSNNYQFNWKNKCLCWNGCKGVGPTPGGGGGGITGGEVFLIILFASLFVYFVVFVLINRFARQQTGLDVLPHRGFWGALFGYTKDGVMFLVSRVTGKGGNYQSV